MKGIIISVIAILAMATGAMAQPFSGGNGTAADPYKIATAVDLNEVRDYLTSHFVLTADIDLAAAGYDTGRG